MNQQPWSVNHKIEPSAEAPLGLDLGVSVAVDVLTLLVDQLFLEQSVVYSVVLLDVEYVDCWLESYIFCEIFHEIFHEINVKYLNIPTWYPSFLPWTESVQ